MAQDRADQGGTIRNAQRRRWQRRPASRRSNLTPDEIAALEEERRRLMRTAHIGIQVTPDERTEIETRARAQRVRLSDYVREAVLSPEKAPLPPPHDSAAINALAFQLSKIGTNLNQLMEVLNLAKYGKVRLNEMPREEEVRKVLDAIVPALEKVYGL